MPQPRYFPFLHGVYDVKAGIEPMGRDHGHGELDRRVFQLDEQFDTYHAVKRAAAERPGRHHLRDAFTPEVEHTVARWVAARLTAEYPRHFAWDGPETLRCALTGDTVGLGDSAAEHSPLDALAMQVQSDWAVLVVDERGGNRVPYLHVSMPSGWAPEEKVGRAFSAIHAPVPHIEPINAKQDAIAKLMVSATRGAVRFAWTVTTDPELNHHPLANDPRPADPHQARSARDVAPHAVACILRGYTPGDPLLRVERQVIWGFPKHRAALFTIRTYRYTLANLDAPARAALARAVAGMSDASLCYKQMDRPSLLAWLGAGGG